MKSSKLAILVVCLLSPLATIWGQNNDKKESTVKIVADKEEETGQPENDKTGFVTTISHKQFDKRYTSLTDVLMREGGIRVRRYGGLGSYSTLSIRGSNANQVNIFIDGVPLNNAQGGEINLSNLPLESLEKIEIYKSGSPPGFIGSAIGGVVNLVTKKGKPKERTSVQLGGGSLNTAKLSAFHQGFNEFFRYTLYAVKEKSDQNFVYRDNNGTLFNTLDDFDNHRRNAWFDRSSGSFTLSSQIGKTLVTFVEDANYRRTGIPGPGSHQTKKTNRTYARSTSSVGTSTKGFLLSNLDLNTRAFYTGSYNHLYDPLSEFSSGTPNSRAVIQDYGFIVMPDLKLPKYHQTFRFHFSDERETFQRDYRNADDHVITKNSRKFRNHTSIKIQDEISTFQDRFILTPVFGHEEYVDRFNETSTLYQSSTTQNPSHKLTVFNNYRLGANLFVAKGESWQLHIKGNASKENRIPTFMELFGERGQILGNTALKPEKSQNADLGPEFDFFWKSLFVRSSLSGFSKHIEHMIIFIPNSQFTLKAENIDSASIQGFEFQQKYELGTHWAFNYNLTVQKAINTSNSPDVKGNYLPLRPLYEWNATLKYKIDRWEFGFEPTFIGAVFRDRSNSYAGYQSSRWIDNIYLTYYFGNEKTTNTYLTVEVKNITDRRIQDITGYPLPGRLFYASIQYTF